LWRTVDVYVIFSCIPPFYKLFIMRLRETDLLHSGAFPIFPRSL
jgi:hypothetical protein